MWDARPACATLRSEFYRPPLLVAKRISLVCRLVGILLLVFGLAQLGFRGMQRARNDIPLWDFASVWSATRTWLHGGDPYNTPAVIETWHRSGLFADRDASYFATVYPPTSLLLIVPLAMLSARVAVGLWLVLTLALLAGQFAALVSMARFRWRDSRSILLVGAALASAPLQFGILSGQLSIPAISLCVIAFWCADVGKEKLAGALLGLACALKPQIAGPFVVYYLLVRRFKVVGLAALVGIVVGVVALVAMYLSHVNWLSGWMQSVASTTKIGAVNDYGWGNRFRDEIVDLKMLLVSVIHNPTLIRAIVLCAVVAMFAWFVHACCPDPLLTLAAFAAISLLPVYHRVYDVALLTTALAWALVALDGTRRRHATGLFIVMAVFLIPFDSIKSVGNRVPGLIAASKTAWFQTLVVPHYAWALFLLTIGLLMTMSSQAARNREPQLSGRPAQDAVSPAK
jgi:hypothetical protein